MAFLTAPQVEQMGFKSVGKDVLISEKASIYNPQFIELGNEVRIDDFAILSAGPNGFALGNYVHIACNASLIGKGRIEISDFSGLSGRAIVYSSNDDYSGNFMMGPILPPEFTNITHAPVFIGKHTAIGAGSIVLPNVRIGNGVSIGALSVVRKDVKDLAICLGNPLRIIGKRATGFLELEQRFWEHIAQRDSVRQPS